MFWKKKKIVSAAYSGPIEIFARHCIYSSISQHKERPEGFSREACHRNFLNTLDPDKAHVTYFLDTAKGFLSDHFLSGSENIVQVQSGSEAKAFLDLLAYVEKLNLHPGTILYFVEDDYLHREGWLDVLREAFELPEVDYATLYDHRDKYFFASYRKLTSKIFYTPSCHWRQTPSTTNTFAVRYKTLMDDLAVHRKFSEGRKISADHDKFCYLQKKGSLLVSSLPGWSTHCEPKFASPCVDWDKLLKSSQKGAL